MDIIDEKEKFSSFVGSELLWKVDRNGNSRYKEVFRVKVFAILEDEWSVIVSSLRRLLVDSLREKN
jgi:hypothetical protein